MIMISTNQDFKATEGVLILQNDPNMEKLIEETGFIAAYPSLSSSIQRYALNHTAFRNRIKLMLSSYTKDGLGSIDEMYRML